MKITQIARRLLPAGAPRNLPCETRASSSAIPPNGGHEPAGDHAHPHRDAAARSGAVIAALLVTVFVPSPAKGTVFEAQFMGEYTSAAPGMEELIGRHYTGMITYDSPTIDGHFEAKPANQTPPGNLHFAVTYDESGLFMGLTETDPQFASGAMTVANGHITSVSFFWGSGDMYRYLGLDN